MVVGREGLVQKASFPEPNRRQWYIPQTLMFVGSMIGTGSRVWGSGFLLKPWFFATTPS